MQFDGIYKGLSSAEVEESRKLNGINVLTPKAGKPLWMQFAEKFEEPLIVILMIAGLLSIGISCYEYFGLHEPANVFFEPVGIFVAILLATGLSFYFELQAEKEFVLLNQVNDDEPVELIRNGVITQVPRKDVVVGDVVMLNIGEEIPADCELLEAVRLSVDESTLTGEPICSKSADAQDADSEATYPSNHVLKGTKVMEGHAVCRVFAVGDKTEQGKVFEAAGIDGNVKTPLNEQLDGLSAVITKLSYGFAGAILFGRILMFFLNYDFEWVHFTAYLLQSLMIVVTLVVVAVPEGLPMAVTLSLAFSMRRMLKTNNLVRKLNACETMGAATVICTDKTGTLTKNKMEVSEAVFYDDSQKTLMEEGMAVNSTAELDFSGGEPKVLGNPTEGALLLWLHDNGVDYQSMKSSAKVKAELPFSTERKYMATVVESAVAGRTVLYVKGAPEIVLSLCSRTASDIGRVEIESRLLEYQTRAMRTLGFAWQIVDDGEEVISENGITASNLEFSGIVAISDPVRDDVPDAVNECREAGISVKIVTGDTPATAMEVGRRIGLWDDATDSTANIITGAEFASLEDSELLERVMDLKIIARARPMDKKRLVEALQARNQVVAVTGDGTNDAPALKAAHVGLSMGDGTSVAKEASDITIIDNSFSSIGKAVMWGRSLYRNIQRFLLFQLTVNVTACFLVLCGAFMGTESPLSVTQMLWINLIMDTLAAVALSTLPPSRKVMKEKPRDRKAFILSKSMVRNIFGVGGILFLILLGLLYIFRHAEINSLADLLSLEMNGSGEVTRYELTLLFTIFVMTHFFYLFNAKAFGTGGSALNLKGCNGLITIALIVFLGQVAMVEIPGVQQFFNVTGLKLSDWVVIILGSSLVLWLREAWVLLRRS